MNRRSSIFCLCCLIMMFSLAGPIAIAHGGQCAGGLQDRADAAVNPAGANYDVYFTDDDITDADYAPLARVQWVRDALVDSHDVYVSANYNFKAPYFSKSPNDTCVYDMSAGILGSAPEGHINIDAPHVENGVQQRIIETTLHELFHHVQFAYIKFNDWPTWGTWTIEGTAAMMEDKVFAASDNDGSSGYVSRVNNLLGDPNRTLTDRSYDAALFWTYLTEQLGTNIFEPGRGVDVVRRFWANTEGNSPDSVKYLRQALSSYDDGATLETIFRDFCITNYTHNLDTGLLGNPARYRYADETAAGGGTAYNAVSRTAVAAFNTTYTDTVNRWGARYFDINIGNEKRCEAIGFWGKAKDGKSLSWALIAMAGGRVVDVYRSTGNAFYRALINPPRGLYDKLAAVVIGLDRGADFDYAFGWGAVDGEVRLPTMDNMAYVGAIGDPPERFQVRMALTGPAVLTPSGSGTVSLKGLDASDFQASLISDSTGAVYPASIVSATYVSGEYWLVVQAPDVDPGDGQLYDLEICFCQDADTCQMTMDSRKSVLYTEVTRNQILALDRSYSMHYPTADPKLTAAKNACRAYVNAAADKDRMGFVTFSGNDSECDNDIDNRQYQVNLSSVAARRNTLISAIDRVTDDSPWKGWTSIGDGLVEARNLLLTAMDPVDVNSIVLLSDGLENEGDFWNAPNSACSNPAVKDSFMPGGMAQNIRIDSLAFGPDADETKLQDIAVSTGGLPYSVTLDSAAAASAPASDASVTTRAASSTVIEPGMLAVPNRLANAYLSIGEDVHENDRFYFNAISMTAGDSAHLTIPVTEKEGGGVSQAVFVFNWDHKAEVRVELVDADGKTVASGGNWKIYQAGQTNKTYHYLGILPPGEYNAYIDTGSDIQLMCMLSGRVVHGVDIDMYLSQPNVYEKCDYEKIAHYLRGLPVTVLVNLNDTKGGITDVPNVEAQISFTTNKKCAGVKNPANRLVLYDDGDHDDGMPDDGVYGNIYTRTPCYSAGEEDATHDFPESDQLTGQSAAYSVTVAVTGQSHYKERFNRYISRNFQVYEYENRECEPDRDKDGLPDRWEDLYGLDKTNPADAGYDNDADQLKNLDEFLNGTLPFDPDTDKGGESDGSEVAAGRDPLYEKDDLLPAVLDYGVLAELMDIPGFEPQRNTNIVRFPVNPSYQYMHLYRRGPISPAFSRIKTFDLAATPTGVYFDTGLINGNSYQYYLVAEGASGARTPPTEVFIGIPPADGNCATFDFVTDTFHIPCVDIYGTAFWLDLKWVGGYMTITNYGLAASPAGADCAFYNPADYKIHVPCVDLGGNITFWVDLQLYGAGILFVDFGLNP